ncbi:MAG: hypothetical protein ABIS86_01425 [Streptosporangiaceae bacterium]
MPRGTYLHLESETEEHFQCAPGPAGWRYVSESTDLTVDSRWRQIRVQLRNDDWLVRGGLAGRDLLWIRNDQEFTADAYGFLTASPGFLVTVARSLGLAPGGHADVRLVQISGPSLAARTITQRWTLTAADTHPTDLGPLPVEAYAVTDLETAESYEWHLAGDVVLAAPGIELTALESPPTL